MSYRLAPGETVADGIKRIAYEQIDRAMASLTDPGDPDEAIHDARKRFKKVRAALRLVRDEIGEDTYNAENVSFRDAGRALANARDAYSDIETLDGLKAHFDDQLYARTFRPLRQALAERHEDILQRTLAEGDNAIEDVAETIEAARARVADWPIEHDDASAFYEGLRRVYRRGRNRYAEAHAQPTEERVHEWRKRAKYLWYHTRILRNVWPQPMKKLADEVHLLTDHLGDWHDLAELRDLVLAEPELCSDKPGLQTLMGLMGQRQAELLAAAWPLAQRIYHEKPGAFTDRVAAYWKAWEQAPEGRRGTSALEAVAGVNS